MRVQSGVPGFDELVDGGIPGGHLYVLSGPPGSGKTTFSAQFIRQGVSDGERCLYLSMHETESELVEAMDSFNFGFKEANQSGRIKFLNVLSERGEDILDAGSADTFRSGVQSMSTRLVSFMRNHDIDRLVVDSAMMIRYFYSEEEMGFIKFVTSLKRTDATTLLVSEMTDPSKYSDEHYLANGVVFLHNFFDEGTMNRGVQTLKMRGTRIDPEIKVIRFSDRGLTVEPARQLDV